MSDIAILGCGPAGLLCAYACEQAGHSVGIYSRKEKSVIPGSQHLHGPIPGLTAEYPEGTIQFVRIGTSEGYAQKVYGDPSRETGWRNYLQVYPSWNVIRAYDKLWEKYKAQIIHEILGEFNMPFLISNYDLVISTLPAQVICKRPSHTFHGTPYYIKTLPTPPEDEGHEIVVYNGLLTDEWYRWSILGGLCSIEYTKQPSLDGEVTVGLKAITNDCNCWPEIQRCGRWAEWKHGVTMYKAYQKAVQLAEAL